MAVNGQVFTIATPNEETFTSLCGQLKELLKAGDADFENLCVSKNINIWSPYKPIRSSEPSNIDYNDRKAANFGIGFPIKTSPADVKSVYDSSNDLNGWEHLAPRGWGNSEYNRMRDWDNYNHAATSPFAAFMYPATSMNKQGSTWTAQTILQGAGGASNNTTITIADMADLKDRFFAIQIKQGNVVRTRTAAKTIGEGGAEVIIPTDQMPTGEYEVIPFIAPMALEYNVALPNMQCIPIPYNKAGVLTIVSSNYIINMEAWKVGNNTIEYKYTIKNTSAAAKTFTNNYIYFRLREKAFSDTLVAGVETQQLLLIPQIAAGATYDSGWLSKQVTSQVYLDPKLWLSLDNGNEISSIIPLSSAGDRE